MQSLNASVIQKDVKTRGGPSERIEVLPMLFIRSIRHAIANCITTAARHVYIRVRVPAWIQHYVHQSVNMCIWFK